MADTSETGTGSITLSADDGLDSLRIDGTLVTLAQINALGTTPVTITTSKGELTLTGFTVDTTVGGIPTSGTLDYTYTLSADQTTPGVNESTDVLALEINDAGGSSASGTLTIRIVDDQPSANADTNSVNEGFTTAPTTTSGNVFAAGSAGDAADRLGADVVPGPVSHVSFGATPGTLGPPRAGAHRSPTLAANGSYTYSLDNTHPTVAAMRAGDTLTEVFTYTITDKDGDTASTTLTITINGQNDPPVAVDDGILVTPEDTPLRGIPVLHNDSDPENDPLTVTSATIPPEQGSVTVNPDGTLDFIPAPNFHGTAVITYTISDGHGGTDTAIVTIQITPVDDLPIAVDDALEAREDTPLSGTLTGNDTPSGDGGNVWAKASDPAHGSVVVNPDGSFVYTPSPDYHGPDSFTYTITDADGDVSTATVTLTVKPVDDLPIAVDDALEAREDMPLSGTLTGNDTPSGDGGNVWAKASDPAHGSVVVNPDGSFVTRARTTTAPTASPTPSPTPTATCHRHPHRQAGRRPPHRGGRRPGSREDTPLSGTLTGNDTPSGDGGNVWAKASDPAHGSVVVNPDGSFVYTPSPDYHGPDSFTYTITDADGDVVHRHRHPHRQAGQ
ncbi:MAG: tandem-95 repeat protein [Zoogloea sp.]|nr:tandem-95 repeat protein [Zoogloea sp.]